MRSAPFGLIPHLAAETVYKLSADAASLTHGHPAARQSAGVFSLVIHALASGRGLREAAESALGQLRGGILRKGEEPDPDVVARLEAALRLAGRRRGLLAPRTWSANSARGGWPRRHSPSRFTPCWPPAGTPGRRTAAAGRPAEAHFRAAIAVAVNHSGDSDSTASIAGNILGTFYGERVPAGGVAGGAGGAGGHPGHGVDGWQRSPAPERRARGSGERRRARPGAPALRRGGARCCCRPRRRPRG